MPPDLLDRCRRAVTTLPDGAVFSHTTAAALHGLPLPDVVPHRLQLRIPRDAYLGPGSPFLVHEREGGAGAARAHGLPVTTEVETWVDLTGQLGHGDAVVLGDAVAWRTGGVGPLAEAVAAMGGGAGAVTARAVLAHVRAGVHDADESRLRLLARAAGLPEPVIGLDVGDAYGRVTLGWPQSRLAVRLVTGRPPLTRLTVTGTWRLLTVASPGRLCWSTALREPLRTAFLGGL